MTPHELTEQTIAAFAAWKKDPKTPLEAYHYLANSWLPFLGENPNWKQYNYRIAPFTLGNSINGHTLGEGEQWHRVDGWTAEMLPAPYRPLIIGEELVLGEPLRYGNGTKDVVKGIAGETPAEHAQCHFTTTRPLPSALKPAFRDWNCAEDVPDDCWLSEDEGKNARRVQHVDRCGVTLIIKGEIDAVLFSEIKDWRWAPSHKGPWQPCKTEVK